MDQYDTMWQNSEIRLIKFDWNTKNDSFCIYNHDLVARCYISRVRYAISYSMDCYNYYVNIHDSSQVWLEGARGS